MLFRSEERLAAGLGGLEKAAIAANEKIESIWLNPASEAALTVEVTRERTPNESSRLLRQQLQVEALQLIHQHTSNVARGSLTSLAAAQPPSRASASISARTAAVTFLTTEKGLSILVETARGFEAVSVAVAKPQLNRAIQGFRQVLARPDINAKPAAIALYDLIFRATDTALKRQGIQRIYLTLDGALRYVPFAALHDGRQYLVNRYLFANGSGAGKVSRVRKDSGLRDYSFAVFAASQFDSAALVAAKLDAASLPNAIRELYLTADALQRRRGTAMAATSTEADLDRYGKRFAEFSSKQLSDTMQATIRPKVIHIASHFQFSPAVEAESKLLTRDGFVTLREMSAWNWQGIDLVTFSACNTGLTGAESSAARESGGPHDVVLRAGANNVIASLWMVNDASTATFMPKLYSDTAQAGDWGRRIHNTQRWFARGGAGVQYAHPHHWAAFVLHTRVRF